MGSAYSGEHYPTLPFPLKFTAPSVAYVIGGNPNIFGHVLMCFGEDVGYIHVDEFHNYPKLIPAGSFARYLGENKKKLFYRHMVSDLTNPSAALAEAERLRQKKWLWAVVPHNCVAFAEQIVQAGGSKWTSKTNLPILSAFADSIPARDPVYDLIDRFSTSIRVGNYNIKTLNMDEEGLAKALVDEVGTNSAMVLAVFERLDDKYNSDSDDVAEIYVNLVKKQGGPVLSALRTNKALIRRLIKVLDEGWTTSGEQKCIDYLKTLL